MLYPSPIFYYLEHRHSDLEAVKYIMFELSLNQILLAHGKTEGDEIDFYDAASKSMKIVDNLSDELNRAVAKDLVETE